jgi:CRISPR/Cas system-associated exonuclease Cas4 (RecB family)
MDFVSMKENWQIILNSLLDEIHTGNIRPDHSNKACTYCKYRHICRNAQQEVVKESRLEKEDAA